MTPYNTNLCLSETDCNCEKFVITDDSVIPNDTVGHSVFGYRKIIVSKPDGTSFTYSSLIDDAPDQNINVLSLTSINDFNYTFTESDVDGLYEVVIYNFPLWDVAVEYVRTFNAIVFFNGKLYKIKKTHTGVNPESDVDNIYWDEYVISEETLKTRYAKIQRLVVLCISLQDCYERMVKEAFCDIEGSPCVGICDNKKFSQASKFLMVRKAICISESVYDWASVKKQINILKSICCCGSGC